MAASCRVWLPPNSAMDQSIPPATKTAQPASTVSRRARWASGGIRSLLRPRTLGIAAVLLLGLAGGVLVSRNLERAMGRLNKVVTAVQEGDLKARAVVRNSGDELDELGSGLNVMLDRLEGSMAEHRYDVQSAIYLLALHRLLQWCPELEAQIDCSAP